MKVKDFLRVCDFTVNEIADRNRNIYFINNRHYAVFEDMDIHKVYNNGGYISIVVESYGYDGEYEKRVIA